MCVSLVLELSAARQHPCPVTRALGEAVGPATPSRRCPEPAGGCTPGSPGGGLEVPVVTARQAHAVWSPRPPITTDSRSLLICRHSEQSPDDLSELAPRLLTRWTQPQPSPPLPRPRGGAEGPEGWAAHGQPAGSPILGRCCRLPRHEPLWGQHPLTCTRGSQALGSPPVCACAVAAGLVPTLPPCRGPKPTSPSAAREAGARPRCHQPLASRSPRTRRRSRQSGHRTGVGRRRVPGAARRAQAAPSAAGGGLFRSCHGCLHPGGVTCRGHRAGRGSSHPTLDHGTCGRGRGTGGGGVPSALAVCQTVPRSFSPDRSVSGGRWRVDALRAVPRTGTGDTAHPALRLGTSGQGAGVGVPLDTAQTFYDH